MHRRRLITLLVLLALALVVAVPVWRKRWSANGPEKAAAGSNITPEEIRQIQAILETEKKLDETVWAKERLAEQCGQLVDDFWDALNQATNKWAVLKQFSSVPILPPLLGAPESKAHGIVMRRATASEVSWSEKEWQTFLREAEASGWEIAQVEFRHNRFETDPQGRALRSIFYFSAHLTNTTENERAILEGDLRVEWTRPKTPEAPAAFARIDARGLDWKLRRGPVPFAPVLNVAIAPLQGSYFIDPLITRDLDGDGFAEIILAASNVLFQRTREQPDYRQEIFCQNAPGLIFTGLLEDFDADGALD
ncbi:MAG: hypothetical protein AB1813_30040, partial [Verrucomicrobiota bacterium]